MDHMIKPTIRLKEERRNHRNAGQRSITSKLLQSECLNKAVQVGQ